jgi:hypothetical protein
MSLGLLLQSSQVSRARLGNNCYNFFVISEKKSELDYNLHSRMAEFHVQWANMMFG